MSLLKMNLLGGMGSLAQFTGIGKGLMPAAKRRKTEPFVGIGGKRPPAAGKKPVAGDPNDSDDTSDNGDGDEDGDGDGDGGADDGLDDQALGDDDFGADAPSDDDTPEDAEVKRTSRVARRARRLKQTPKDPPDPTDPPADPGTPPSSGDDDDPDTEMRGNSPLAQARRRERTRCAAIFANKAAATNFDLAAHLAFNTRLTRVEAIGALARGGSAAGGLLGKAMGAFSGQRPGAPPPAEKSKAQQIAAGWDAAFDAATNYRNPKK